MKKKKEKTIKQIIRIEVTWVESAEEVQMRLPSRPMYLAEEVIPKEINSFTEQRGYKIKSKIVR